MKAKTMFDGWSDDALRGYVVMLGEFLLGSTQEDPGREVYVTRLASACTELKVRDDEESGKKASIAFPGEKVSNEEPVDQS